VRALRALRVFVHSDVTFAKLRPPHSYTIGGTGWNVGLHWGYVHHSGVSYPSRYALHADVPFQRLDPPHLSTLDYCRSWSPLRRQLCMPRCRRAHMLRTRRQR
jgi:hypothetical protein